ncbi:MAG: hypothetical protein KDC54_09135 [Lewinella sp.]|nr:hypothetical protein [Lewinella sp.]
MRIVPLLFSLAWLTACQPAPSSPDSMAADAAIPATLAADWSPAPRWKKDGLRLVPITATDDFIAGHAAVAQYKALPEALTNEHFRITEKLPYGRFEDAGAVNNLTVQNKTEETVFLMQGEIVRGGNQDRVIAQDMVIPPRTITDVPVFCVEHGRWTYRDQPESVSEADEKVFAFRGYYNVAASPVRRSVQSGSQQAVWAEVAALTSLHGAASSTSAYAGLESSEDFVAQRQDYERFFSDKLADNEHIVGFVALYEGQVIGADVFAHPRLLNQLYPALLTSYITDAVSGQESGAVAQTPESFTTSLLEETISLNGEQVHLSRLPQVK